MNIRRAAGMGTKYVVTKSTTNQYNYKFGVMAQTEMTQNVSTTKERGEQASQNFISRITRTVTGGNEAIGTELQSLKYSDPIKKQPVLTFHRLGAEEKKVSIKEDEGLSFAAIIAGYNGNTLDIRYKLE